MDFNPSAGKQADPTINEHRKGARGQPSNSEQT